jgi:hypothetical protein
VNKRRVILLLALVGVFVTLFIIAWPTDFNEPRYKGRSLSDWVLSYPDSSGEAEPAIQAIGTNAIPWLLRWMQYEPSPARRRVRSVYRVLPGWLRNRQTVVNLLTGRAGMLCGMSPQAFAALGTNSAPAVPELVRLSQGTNAASLMAVFALSNMGETGLSAILTIMTNGSPQQRMLTGGSLQNILPRYTNASIAVPALLVWLRDPGPSFARIAANSLSQLKSDPTNVVPQLVAALQHPDADVRRSVIWALDSYGDPASVSSVSNCLHDPDFNVREEATNTLKRLRGEIPRTE